jgi:hypothetical protein
MIQFKIPRKSTFSENNNLANYFTPKVTFQCSVDEKKTVNFENPESVVYKTGLTKELQAELEEKLFYPEGKLSPNNTEFWRTFTITLEDGVKLDPKTNPLHELYLYVLSGISNCKIDTDLVKKTPVSFDYVIQDSEVEIEKKNSLRVLQSKAQGVFFDMNPATQTKLLVVLGIKAYNMSEAVKVDYLYNLTNGDLVGNVCKRIIAYKESEGREKLNFEYLIEVGIDTKVISYDRVSSQYVFGINSLGQTKAECITYLKDSSKEKQDIFLDIKKQVELRQKDLQTL